MRDFTDRVGAPSTTDRYPFDLMTRVGDMFLARDMPHRSLAVVVSRKCAGTKGRRFATFPAASGGTRVFLVDIDDQPKSEAR